MGLATSLVAKVFSNFDRQTIGGTYAWANFQITRAVAAARMTGVAEKRQKENHSYRTQLPIDQ